MSWARLDDGFTEHPKILALTDKEFRVHMRAICYASRYRTRGELPASALSGLGATPRVTRRLIEIGVWDEGNPIKIHDFSIYNGETIEEKVEAYLARNPDASANDVHREIGGKRDIVLAVVKQIREVPAGSHPGTQGTGENGTVEPAGNQYQGTGLGGSLSRARADPSPKDQEQEPRAVPEPRLAGEPALGANGPGDLTIRQQIHDSLAQTRVAGGG